MAVSPMPRRGVMFWPVGTGDSTTIVIDDEHVVQVDLHDMAKADDPRRGRHAGRRHPGRRACRSGTASRTWRSSCSPTPTRTTAAASRTCWRR